MSRSDEQLLGDITHACSVILGYVARVDLPEDLVFDAIRIRLVEIGEAVKGLSAETRSQADVPWQDMARMRELLAHRYFDTTHHIVFQTARADIPILKEKIAQILLSGPRE